MGIYNKAKMKVCALVVALIATAAALSIEDDFSSKASAIGSLTAQDYASNPALFAKQQGCLETCGRGICLKGNCVCDQPFCGSTCSRQCQHGGTCSSGPNRCLCTVGWTGEYCEIQEATTAAADATEAAAATAPHDKYLLARTIEGGRIPLTAESDDACNTNRGVLNIPFPTDLDIARVVQVQVMCVDSVRRKIFFGVQDPVSVPVMFGAENKCHSGTNDLVHDTLVQARSSSTDFRYHMEDGIIVVVRLGTSPELDRCSFRATITFYA
eukprot:c18718_g1_i1.p1 GENE.c18718_g1_i1~~c18718_g1_i1.p1  ORF type:complete len:269 (-),score=57.00 c18718_g1_i1:130-936(-)